MATISKTAQHILDARANYPDCTFAELYDENLMPPDLRAAHEANDRAVLVNVANVKVLPIANTQYPIHLRQGYGG